jgi:hypothetical protein
LVLADSASGQKTAGVIERREVRAPKWRTTRLSIRREEPAELVLKSGKYDIAVICSRSYSSLQARRSRRRRNNVFPMTDIPMITRKIFLAASVALAALSTHAEPVQVRDFDIFVDPPTAFVFVKLSQGWKFVGKLDTKALADLPAKVHTSLLVANEGERIADSERTTDSIK